MWDMDSGTSAPQDTNSPKQSWAFDAAQRESAMMVGLYLFFMTFFSILPRFGKRVLDFHFFEQ
jgi:hypothetical protein